MKIAFLITYFYPQTGGAENNCYYTAKELAKNHEVHVFCSGEKEMDETIDRIKVHRSKELFRLKYYFAFYPSLVKKMTKERFDVVHVHGLGFIQHDLVIKKVREKYPNTKIICTPHGPFMALKKYNFFGNIFKAAYTNVIKRGLRFYDKVIEVNPYQEKWMESEYGINKNKIVFVPNGVTNKVFLKIPEIYLKKIKKEYNLENKLIISYLGRIQKYKGLDKMVKILPKLNKLDEKVVFLAIGKDAGDKIRLTELANEEGMADKIIFTEEVSEKDKFALLELSEIFIFPSEWEAFGISMLEAMAKGNAVVSSRTEGGKYLIEEGKNGFLFNYSNEMEFLEKLKIIISDGNLRKKMRKNNIKKAKNFLWEDIVIKLENIYRGLTT